MCRFYSEVPENASKLELIGSDVNHIKNVLRKQKGEKLIICNGSGKEYICRIQSISSEQIGLEIERERECLSELKTRLFLFQGIPKKDKMELIIQKAVELGVYEIIPVRMKRSIVKLEEAKKEQKKRERWQIIAEGAAKQSGRGMIPQINQALAWKEALKKANTLEYNILPYEEAKGIQESRKIIDAALDKKSIGIFIGPEGGFDKEEIQEAIQNGILPITLGRRILRTETAGLAILSLLMFRLEE